MRASMQAFIAALLALEAAIPRPRKNAGELDNSPPRRRRRGPSIVIVPGSGQHVDPNVDTITQHVPQGQSPTNSGPNTNQFEGLPGGNSGGGGGGAW